VSRGWAGGSTRAWRTLRAAVLARDGFRCRAHPDHCTQARAKSHTCTGAAPLSGGPGVAGHVHHTRGREMTGDDPAHLVAACPACNLAIGEPGARTATDPQPRPVTRW
jgi:5-methylcytosine-specific restriction endonuclease McrA